MIRPRIIPSLLIRDKGLVKTVNFKNEKYIGDPLNATRIFNDKEVDEIVIFDIDASVKNNEPDFNLIEKIARQSRMPLCYGGGVKSEAAAQKILELGVEKIALSSLFFENLKVVSGMVRKLGSQSVVLVLDVKKNNENQYTVYIHNGTVEIKENLFSIISKAEETGIGEIIINSIDRDGTMEGYDFALLEKVRNATSLPLSFLGGAGSLNDIKKVIKKHGNVGVAAGSLFVYCDSKKAVLITYPSKEEKNKLFKY
ncbi:AglZ/HisF2 family acetamidino modification protein [Chryseobacterium caseinilyticum]|uniref:imidazole glycerol-phosphate synthase n=1 Tax=Chryseobacterium caseinilyticum TaxID=2771428 RepID=A0ABR8ZBN3_9FLAO|nr:AglZ/HisF2 family acetamidino modification protein [Chryseobacterium caseinilyticum]MBD8082315.1 imidazole glycerol phosphate synthase subunit HisF [Chryseobacterium caseinilyticum]